jgi:ligand-binding SRPBCC domain-containing protein
MQDTPENCINNAINYHHHHHINTKNKETLIMTKINKNMPREIQKEATTRVILSTIQESVEQKRKKKSYLFSTKLNSEKTNSCINKD